MLPGDTLILNPGTYSSTVRITEKNGSPTQWFTMKGSDAGTARILATGYNNMIELRRSSYWKLENLELDGNNFLGSEAFKATIVTSDVTDYAHHVILDNLHVHHFEDVCIDNKATTWDMTVRNCYIHDTNSVGLYLGNSNGYAPIIDLVFENNFVERTGSYNMQIKQQLERVGVARGDTPGLEFTSWGWLVRNSVFMRTDPPANAARPNFLIDAAPLTGPGSNDLATISGNVVLANVAGVNGDHGFQLSGNLRVVNNLVMNVASDGVSGIRIGSHAGIIPRRLEICNNTVLILAGTDTTRCLAIVDVDTTPGLTQIVANNALIRGDTADTAYTVTLPPTAIATNNIIRGTGSGPGYVQTFAPLNQIFLNPVETPGSANLYPAPGSPLIGAANNAHAPADDFNGVPRPRGGLAEVGAYEILGPTNPGWQLDRGFKRLWTFGDLDHDGDVDLGDHTLFALALAGPGAPTSNPEADLDDDGDCDLYDVAPFAADFTDPH